MSENQEASKYLKLARTAREEGNSEDAKLYYQKLREEDPENAEAKYFYAYYALYEGTNGELPRRFSNLCTVVLSAVKMKADLSTIKLIVESFVPETWSMNRYMNKKNHEKKVGDSYVTVFEYSKIVTCGKEGLETTKKLGDLIDQLYGASTEGKQIAAIAWKEYVSLSQKWFSWATKGDPELYTEKIQKVYPDYIMPKKAGCISFADNKNE